MAPMAMEKENNVIMFNETMRAPQKKRLISIGSSCQNKYEKVLHDLPDKMLQEISLLIGRDDSSNNK